MTATDVLFRGRKLAIMQLKQGKTEAEVAQNRGRCVGWVCKWQKRFKAKGWKGLLTQSRAPKQPGNKVTEAVRVSIRHARLELEAEAAVGEGLKYIGGPAVKTWLKKHQVTPLPSIPTIERVLREAGMTRSKAQTVKSKIVYPHLTPCQPHHLFQLDIVPHFLQGGQRVACCNAIDVVSRYCAGLPFAQRRAQDRVTFLVHVWREMGVPTYTQVDNEGCFSGGTTHPHVLGQVVRWSALYYGINFYLIVEKQTDQLAALESQATSAQLAMLRYQLNPHFLFNTLNAIATLVLEQANDTAEKMFGALSRFLRFTLDQDPQAKVPLKRELEVLDLYLRIEKMRFEERLILDIQIDPAAEHALVPSLILQPVIENAIKYAVASNEDGCRIAIRGLVNGEWLELELTDNGPGSPSFAPGAAEPSGVGLRNTRERLATLYGERQRLAVENRPEGGVRVRITLPFEEQ